MLVYLHFMKMFFFAKTHHQTKLIVATNEMKVYNRVCFYKDKRRQSVRKKYLFETSMKNVNNTSTSSWMIKRLKNKELKMKFDKKSILVFIGSDMKFYFFFYLFRCKIFINTSIGSEQHFSPLFLTSKATGWCSRHLYQWQYQLCANVINDNNVTSNRQTSITMEKCTS